MSSALLCTMCRPYGGCISVGACPTEQPNWREKEAARLRSRIQQLEQELSYRRQDLKEVES